MNDPDILARLTRMEDIEAIKQLKALYCEICDDDHNPDRIVTIFTDDCGCYPKAGKAVKLPPSTAVDRPGAIQPSMAVA